MKKAVAKNEQITGTKSTLISAKGCGKVVEGWCCGDVRRVRLPLDPLPLVCASSI